ncbi:hypothetical protein [Streptomyces microflavus]|uniref:hypothetical protein n=1 Tax=Streptomyces microflavus TaxID=1919 RepID=UPI0033ECA118|nr:hypothetical protein OG269_21330 [Streptomyces microflavus]WST15635.1 hypothetical protein OG721_17450 [Streptomyces microflavus]
MNGEIDENDENSENGQQNGGERDMGGQSDAESGERQPVSGDEPAGTDPPGGIVIGEFGGGAVAVGRNAKAEDAGRRIGRTDGVAGPPPVVAPLPGGLSVGRMTGGAAASGPDAQAIDRSDRFIEATPQLIDAILLLRGQTGEVGTAAAEAEREIRDTGGVERGRLQRLGALTARAARSVGEQTAAGVAAGVIGGMLT